jgi:hypothetical protein
MRDNMEKECTFCGKKRKGKDVSDTDWISEIHIISNLTNTVIDRMTVCPQCRDKHMISDLYALERVK